MFVFETKIFKPIYDKVLVPWIQNECIDDQNVVEPSNSNRSQFKLKNPKNLEKELEIEELRKYIKHIRRVKRYIRQKVDEMQDTVPKSKVTEIRTEFKCKNLNYYLSNVAKKIQEAEEEIDCPEIDK